MPQEPLILGIESSCDDTAAAILRGREILSSVVLDQGEVHAPFGGVVPELAARAHAEKLDIAAKHAFKEAGVKLEDLDAIAVTSGPGLIGGLLASVSYAKGLAFGSEKPLIGVNHLAGHALTPRLTDGLSFPYLMLLVSGGHCLFLIAHSATDFTRLGSTIDDAPGEAFDKTAKLLGLGYPGGPKVEHAAMAGDPKAYKFPRPLLDCDDCNLSFSGLKTALRRETDKLVAAQCGVSEAQRADLCASFQAAAADCLASKAKRAMARFKAVYPTEEAYIAVAGGVAANKTIGNALRDMTQENGFTFTAPPMSLCTDNAAMIAWAGVERFKLGLFDDMSLEARPRWPLDKEAMPIFGSGKKGAKA